MAEPSINVDLQWFDLKADPAVIDTAATAWTTLGGVGDDTGTDLNTAAQVVYDDPWEGDTREAYEGQQKKLRDSCVGMVEAAKPIATALGNIASALRSKQGDLTTLKSEITGAVDCTIGGQQITFRPKTPEESKKVLKSVTDAKAIRSDLDTTLSTEQGKLSAAQAEWTAMSSQWQAIADGGVDGAFPLPPEITTPSSITMPDGTVVLSSGSGNDDVSVTTKPDGTVVVTVNGQTSEYPPGTEVVLHTGSGNDNVEVDPNANVPTTVVSGDGNDTVDTGDSGLLPSNGSNTGHTVLSGDGKDSITMGDGDNRVSTGGGDDSVTLGDGDNMVSTGDGNDAVDTPSWFQGPGGGGDNMISTGRGDDTVESGSGDDRVYGGDGADNIRSSSGNDTVVAGRGDDKVFSGDGDDQVYGGDGRDYVDGGDGDDRVNGGEGNDVLYGMHGDDEMYGGTGDDYMEGARGNDKVHGGDGDDLLSGGRGDDEIYGGDGSDKMYAGHGKDYTDGGDGSDTAFAQDEDSTSTGTETTEKVDIVDHSFIKVEGDEEFTNRTEADLDMLAASPTGQEGIEHLRDHRDPNIWGGNHELTIRETEDGNSASSGDQSMWGNKDSEINYNPSGVQGWDERPPVLGLYHEMAHVNTFWDGSYDGDKVGGNGPDQDINKAERQATGLPTDGRAYDPANPEADLELDYELTENGLRDEFGLPPRTTYT
ncbi:M91 family zinc metallopeptidase [Stackebrandtia soli]|uniref:M91 family zinc metallopeptidase n=1 Tax=Stackebrandtia soli TaxID=1892856 RepID=UPI0039EB679B